MKPEWALELAAQVRGRRKALRLTQKQVADLSRCGPDFLYDVERGKPTLRLDKLIPVLGVLGLKFKLEPQSSGVGTVTGDWISSTPGQVKR